MAARIKKQASRPAAAIIQMRAANPDGDVLERLGLRTAAAGVPNEHPDAELMRNLAELREADVARAEYWAQWNAPPQLRRMERKEAQRMCHEAAATCEKLRALICDTPARTVEGALAKVRFVLDTTEGGGTQMHLPLSALRDVIALELS